MDIEVGKRWENVRIFNKEICGKGVIYMNLSLYPYEYTNESILNLLSEMVNMGREALYISNKNGLSSFDLEINASGVKSKQLNLQFGRLIAETMKSQFPDKLDKCNIYKPPAFFEVMFDLIKTFIDKKTQQKINIVKTNIPY